MSKVITTPLPSKDDLTYKCIKIDGETIAIPLCIFVCARGKNAKLEDAKFIFENEIHWYICDSEYENRTQIERDVGDRTIGHITMHDCPKKARLSREAEKLGLHGPVEDFASLSV